VRPVAQVPRGHHPVQRQLERIGEEVGDAAQRLVFARVQHVQDRADQQGVTDFLPGVAPLQCAFGIDQDVGNVLHAAHLMRATPHLQQRVVSGRSGVGGVEQQAVREARASAGGQTPVLALDVVDHRRGRPRQQGGHHETHAFA